MKLTDGIIERPFTGVCKIDVDKIVKCWGKNTFISCWRGGETPDYRLCDKNIKVTLSKEDTQTLIEKLALVEVVIKPFANGSSYMTKERRERYAAAMKVPDLVMEVMQCVVEKKQGLNEKEKVQYFKGIKKSLKTFETFDI